jgi:hypothetical protein
MKTCSTIEICLMNVGSEVSTAMVMMSIIFWDMTPYSLLSCNSAEYTSYIPEDDTHHVLRSSQQGKLYVYSYSYSLCYSERNSAVLLYINNYQS